MWVEFKAKLYILSIKVTDTLKGPGRP